MADPFIGEVRIWGHDFAPRDWAFCDGRILQISQFSAVFALLRTQFGGNGRTTFAIPELRGRVPVHPGQESGPQGTQAGSETVTLTQTQMPQHQHGVAVTSSTGTTNEPAGDVFAAADDASTYAAAGNLTALAPDTLANAGGGQPHNNLQPTLALNFTIALYGIFPPRD